MKLIASGSSIGSGPEFLLCETDVELLEGQRLSPSASAKDIRWSGKRYYERLCHKPGIKSTNTSMPANNKGTDNKQPNQNKNNASANGATNEKDGTSAG